MQFRMYIFKLELIKKREFRLTASFSVAENVGVAYTVGVSLAMKDEK
jgi:hypothetical protein